MKVLSLFDGMGCGIYALKKAGLPITSYFASEIDKYAISIAKKNHPEITHLGCVKNVRQMAEAGFFGWVDLLIAGSPCQGFSFAGKQLAFDDPRSQLFFEFVYTLQALKKVNPNIKFMLENVKMKKEHLDVISNFLGVQPILINSALVSAQNRQRYYWCNWTVQQPADRGIYLKDIIETGEVDRDKSYCIDANYYKGGSLKNYLEKARRQNNLSPSKIVNVNPSGNGMNGWVYDAEGKSPTLTTNKGEGSKIAFHQSEKRLMVKDVKGAAIRGRYNESDGIDQGLEIREDEKSNCLTSVQKDSLLAIKTDKPIRVGHIGKGGQGERIYSIEGKSVTLKALGGGQGAKSGLYLFENPLVVASDTTKGFVEIPPECGVDLTFPKSKTRRGRKMEHKSNCLTAAPFDYNWYDGVYYRKLTPIECERLQTLPDDYSAGVSNSQRYKMLGNGWTADVIAHIFGSMPV